jgi:hypothetical protein
MENVHIGSTGGTALRLAGTFLGALYNVYLRNAVNGLVMNYDDSAGNLAANAINFHGGEIQAVENIGSIEGSIAISFFGMTMEGSSVSGLDVRAACKGISIHGGYIEANTGYDIRVGENGTVLGFVCTGGYFTPGGAGVKDRAIILRSALGVSLSGNYFYGYNASPILVNESAANMVTGSANNNHNSVGSRKPVEVQAGVSWNRPEFGTRMTIGDGTGGSAQYMNGAPGTSRQTIAQSNGVNRWLINWASAIAEAGGNAGSNIEFLAYDDAGVLIGSAFSITRATRRMRAHAELQIDGTLNHDGTTVGFYGAAPVAKPTGVAVTPEAIHAALVSLGLIAG